MTPEQAKKVVAAVRDLTEAQMQWYEYSNAPHRHVCGADSAYLTRIGYCEKQLAEALTYPKDPKAGSV